MSQQNKLLLAYWPIRGLAERIRLLLQYVGLPYDQTFYYQKPTDDQWFKVDKPKLIQKNPALTLPYLIDGDQLITESTAIIVYICHRANRQDLLGRNGEEKVTLATAFGIYNDYYTQYITLVYGEYTEPTWEEALKNYSPKFEAAWKKLNWLLGNKDYMCGGLTWVDFALTDAIQLLNQLNPAILSQFPLLTDYQKRVWNLQQLQPYFQSERWHDHPVNGEDAKWR